MSITLNKGPSPKVKKYLYGNKDSPCVGIKYEKKRMKSQHFHINLIL